jgi:hypothetical protein
MSDPAVYGTQNVHIDWSIHHAQPNPLDPSQLFSPCWTAHACC